MVSVVPRESIVAKIAREKELVTMDPPMIKVAMESLQAAVETQSGEAIGETAVPVMMSLPSI